MVFKFAILGINCGPYPNPNVFPWGHPLPSDVVGCCEGRGKEKTYRGFYIWGD